jgi:hypothetical protein
MKAIPGKVASFAPGKNRLEMLSVDQIQSNVGHTARTYSDLISKLAQLAFANPEFVLLMRGQSSDHKEGSKTTLLPTMYRMPPHGDYFYAIELKHRYERLQERERQLYEVLHDTDYWDRVGRSELARWAILQHYDICPTPLLDVTHSALVACSFAFLESTIGRGRHFYLYVLGVPQINGAITVSSSHALQVVRLSSVCPPATLRPYFQEGYLMGTYPSVDTLDEKMRYARSEMDCAQRLVAKFKISNSKQFWDAGFQKLPGSAVYPDEQGELCSKIAQLKEQR